MKGTECKWCEEEIPKSVLFSRLNPMCEICGRMETDIWEKPIAARKILNHVRNEFLERR